jgi:aarF domain-containing kinase
MEITHATRVGELLRDHKNATVPRMFTQLCTPRLIVMEWIDGVKISDKAAMKSRDISPRAVGLQLVKLFGELTMIHGFMHGDPHAGNLMVRMKGRLARAMTLS